MRVPARGRPFVLLGCAVLRPACGQTAAVIPADSATHDAPGIGEVAGLSQAFRQQILVRDAELRDLRGRTLTAVWFRRDVQLAMPLRGGKAQLTVTLSDRARSPATASARFADNRGPEPHEVFRGVVDVPSPPAPTGPTSAAWAAPTAIEIAFTTPFAYRDGTLCLEIEGRPVPGQQAAVWPVDYAMSAVNGTMAMAGRSCDVRLQAMAVSTLMIPGNPMTMFGAGPAETTSVCLVGRLRTPPLDLRAQGMPDCFLHVEPFDATVALYPRVKAEPITRIERKLPVPGLPCFLGASFSIQWLNLPSTVNRAHITTTHVQSFRLSTALPAFPGAMIRTGATPGPTFAETGDVQTQQMPVLRFLVR